MRSDAARRVAAESNGNTPIVPEGRDVSTIRFTVSGVPVPQPRHRIGQPKGMFARAYIDAAHPVHAFKDHVRLAARGAMRSRPAWDAHVTVSMLFVMPRPKSARKCAEYAWHVVKPDADNLAKSALDAMKGIIYTDDSLIVDARFLKVTAPTGAEPTLYVEFRACGDAHETVTDFLTAFTS